MQDYEVSREHEISIIEAARVLRRESTASEELLWQALRSKQLDGRKFRRQHPIGKFVVDFICISEHLIIEVDGSIHEHQREADAERQHILEELGYTVLRSTATDVETNLSQVLATIRNFWM